MSRKQAVYEVEFGRGWRAGYSVYRYGPKNPVSLAGPKFKPEPIVRGQKRRHLVDRVLDLLRDWRSSPFENEGAALAGLRSAFCLKGHDWSRSDHQASALIAEALRLMGAERPSFEEAQRGHPLGSDYCHWCFCAIDEDDRSRGRRFCSVECARMGVLHMARKTNHHYGAVLRSAIRMLDADKADPRACEYCGMMFKSDRAETRFCSNRCAGMHKAGDRLLLDRQCEHCHITYKPVTQVQRYCSQSCSQRAKLKAEAESLSGVRRNCGHCGRSFQPETKTSLYCSRKCQKAFNARKWNEKTRVTTPPPAECAWCGETYQPKIKLRLGKAGYCSLRCGKDAHRFSDGSVPKELTRRVFDHYFTTPINKTIARQVTPQRLDWFFLQQGLRITGEVRIAA